MPSIDDPLKNSPDHFFERPKDRPYPLSSLQDGSVDEALNGVWQYGLLSTLAYDDAEGEAESADQICEYETQYASRWVRVPEFSIEGFGLGERINGIVVPGLVYSVWHDVGRNRVTLVFRGTNFVELGDWYSNFRFGTRLNPLTADQYDQTNSLVEDLVPALKDRYGSNVEIIATGHSLGGGLAQRAGMSSPDISTVFAFASSPVTGEFGYNQPASETARKGLKIFRIHESGEIMAAGRWVHRSFYPLPPENPKVTELLFSFGDAFYKPRGDQEPIGQHGIRKLTCNLICRVELGKGRDECDAHRSWEEL